MEGERSLVCQGITLWTEVRLQLTWQRGLTWCWLLGGIHCQSARWWRTFHVCTRGCPPAAPSGMCGPGCSLSSACTSRAACPGWTACSAGPHLSQSMSCRSWGCRGRSTSRSGGHSPPPAPRRWCRWSRWTWSPCHSPSPPPRCGRGTPLARGNLDKSNSMNGSVNSWRLSETPSNRNVEMSPDKALISFLPSLPLTSLVNNYNLQMWACMKDGLTWQLNGNILR